MTENSFSEFCASHPQIPVRLQELGVLGRQCAEHGLNTYTVMEALRGGRELLHTDSHTPDRVNPAMTAIKLQWRTDGVWWWSEEVSEYVRRYQMTVPDEFLAHLARKHQ